MAKFKYPGVTIPITPAADVVDGQLVKVGTSVTLAEVAIPANKKGAVRTCGVIEIEMATVASLLVPGTELDVNFTTQKAVTNGTGDADCKIFVSELAQAGTNVKLKCFLNRFGG